MNIWAATWQKQQNDCAPSEDHPGRPPSLIKSLCCPHGESLSYPLSAQRRLWSDWADAQADLSLRWANRHFVGFVMRLLILLCSKGIQLYIYTCVNTLSVLFLFLDFTQVNSVWCKWEFRAELFKNNYILWHLCLMSKYSFLHLAPTRYYHISYVHYLVVMSSKFIISPSQSANQINGYQFSTFL